MGEIHKKIRVGVVGVGHLGIHHARIYASLPGVELVGVVDLDQCRAREIAKQYHCMATPDVRTLIGKIDAASVVVPTLAHDAVASTLLDAHIHVLLEKPMASTLLEADHLTTLSAKRGMVLQVGHIERFNAGFLALQKRVRQPRFIECHRMGPFTNRGIDVPITLDLMIHDIDAALCLIRDPVVEMRAVGVSVLTPHIDIANARLRFAQGAVANLTASRVSPTKLRKLRLFEPQTYFSLDYLQQELTICKAERNRPETNHPSVSSEKMTFEKTEPLYEELAAFIRAVKNGTAPEVSAQDGRNALEIALEVERLMHVG